MMTRVEGSLDWESVLQVVRAISVVEDLDDFGPAVLEAIDPLIPSANSSYNEVDPLARRALVVSRPFQPTPEEIELWQQWAHQNPALMHMLRTGDGSPKRISDFISTEELHRLELYTYVYRDIGVEYQLAVSLPAPRPLVIGIALNRADRDFQDDEVALLDALRPHLVQAYRNAQLLTERRRTLEAIAGAFEEEGRVFQVLGEPLSESARRLLALHFDGNFKDLPESVLTWAAEERAWFDDGAPHRLRQPLVSNRGGRRLTIRFVRGGKGPDLLWIDERPTEVNAEPLQRLGLSSRQAEVLWHLTKGRPPKEIARYLDVSPGTVRKHLEHVYRKLGVSTATAAVAQAVDALTTPGT